MKKLIILSILLSTIFAGDRYILSLYEKILPPIFKTNYLLVYADKDTYKILNHSTKLLLTNNCKDASLLIGKNFKNLQKECQNKPRFATNYRYFKENSDVFGVFYWRKGRPQLRFRLKTMRRYNLYLPTFLRKYAK